nr:zinc finger, CCHC-type [Tanacetum cinerariifolium]
MVIKDLDLEPTIDDMMRDFLQASVLHQSDDDASQRHHIVPIGELNGVSIALVARPTSALREVYKNKKYWPFDLHKKTRAIRRRVTKHQEKKIRFLLTTLKVVYVLSTPMPEFIEDEPLDQTRRRCKWENDNYIYYGHILNGMSNALFDVYQNVGLAKELWDQLESKYMTGDASSKKFLVSNFNNYKMVDSRGHRVVAQCGNEDFHAVEKDTLLLTTLKVVYVLSTPMPEFIEDEPLDQTRRRCKWENDNYIYYGHILNGDASSKKFLVSNFNNYKMVDSRAEESGKGKGKEIVGSALVNMIEDGKNKNNNKNTKGKKRKNDGNNDGSNKKSKQTCWKCGETGHFKKDYRVKKNNGGTLMVRDKDLRILIHHKMMHLLGGLTRVQLIMRVRIVAGLILFIQCKMDSFYIWATSQPNEYLAVEMAVVRLTKPKRNFLGERVTESRDAMFDEKRFTSIPRPKSLMLSSNEDQIGETPIETPTTRGSNRARIAKSFGYDFQLYLVEGSRDEIGPQYSYCYSIEEDLRAFDEAMQFRDVAFWKEAINDEMDSIMKNNTWILSDLPLGCKYLGCKWILKKKMKVDGTVDKFKARLVIQGFRQKEGIDYFDAYAPVARISIIRLLTALAATYNLVIHQMDVKITFLHGGLKEEVELQQNDLIKTLRTDRGGEYYDPIYFQSVGIIHETAALYTPQQFGVSERKTWLLKKWAVVRLTEPKRNFLGERVIESRDAMFDEKRFTSIPRPKSLMISSNEDQIGETPIETPTTRGSNRARIAKSFGYDFQLYLVEGSRDEIGPQYSYCYSIEEDPRAFDEAMQFRDVAFWKEAINDEMDSIMKNNTWILSDLPLGFKQKEGIDCFDAYAPVARISIIRLLTALAATYNLVIHQMDVKIAFLNGGLKEE